MTNIIRKPSHGTITGVDWSEFDPFRMIDHLMRWEPISARFSKYKSQTEAFIPQFDVKEEKENYIFKADLPGVKEQNLEISLTGHQLTISGKKEAEERKENENFFVIERTSGNFSRTFALPDSIDVSQIKAELKEGVLHIALPKIPEATPKKILVKSGS